MSLDLSHRVRVETGASWLHLAPERGGMATELVLDGRTVLAMDWDSFNDPKRSVRGGIPILFPICGPLREDRFLWKGTAVPMKQHGFARNLPWRVAEQAPGQATLVLESSDATRAAWPFEFALRFRYKLGRNALRIEPEVENRGNGPMPYSLGLHPYFPTPDKAKVRLDLPAPRAARNPYGDAHPFEGRFDFEAPDVDECLLDMRAPSGAILDDAQGVAYRVSADPRYRFFVFWTLQGRDFCCLEPWTARPDSLNTGHADVVEAGQTATSWVEISCTPQ